ncbi:ABC transporter permease [Brachybacterium ginsengisoli]|uniref:ABC transporter permease n=1 Tax=Brachybacterium ginsengisoli TaxID=1331682 RepID=A0A291H167_9MICO|nr:ABC transporter permease [Brachybacterium ginsengisoli]ATG56104.1 ABC transporter permease [Brachybacterium ginsengisoli]
MTGLLASIVEACGELRVNKGRILLSLIGVAFSVFALTAVMGGGGMLTSALTQSSETWAGRDATLTIYPIDAPAEITAEEQDVAVLDQVERLGIEHRTRRVYDSLRMQTPQGVQSVQLTGVDPAYADIFRITVAEGRWLADSDARRLAPALVVNASLYEQLGRPELGTEPVTVYGASGASESEQAIVVGVLPAAPEDDFMMQAYISTDGIASLPGRTGAATASEYMVWVPPDRADEIRERLGAALRNTPAGSFDVNQSSMSAEDLGFEMIAYAVMGVAGVILVLGALGLVNISLVTVRYRVREIGIRRSYGATGGRIFVGVLMESVVATVLAGVVGVTAAVALVKAPFVSSFFRDQGLVELPPFPVEAVLVGLGAATLVGVLAGALPALIATRIRVIDAIRS